MRKTGLWYWLFIFIFTAGLLGMLRGLVVQAATLIGESPTNVGLLYFEATPLNNAVYLEWETATEVGTAGFIIKRGTDNTFVALENIGFIYAEGGPSVGYLYTAEDDTAVNGQTYTYKLFEIEVNSNEVELASQTVSVGPPASGTPTATSVAGGGNSGTPTHTIPVSATPTTSSAGPTEPTNTPTFSPSTTNTQTALTAAGQPAPTATLTSGNSATVPQTTILTTSGTNTATSAGGFLGPQIAQAQEEPTAESETVSPADDPYPGLGPNVSDEAGGEPGEESYPPGQTSPIPVQPESTAFVTPSSATNGGPATPVPVIGSQTRVAYQPPTNQTQTENVPTMETATGGRLYLWGGFIAALILFSSSILGSIILFTRNRESG